MDIGKHCNDLCRTLYVECQTFVERLSTMAVEIEIDRLTINQECEGKSVIGLDLKVKYLEICFRLFHGYHCHLGQMT